MPKTESKIFVESTTSDTNDEILLAEKNGWHVAHVDSCVDDTALYFTVLLQREVT
jgi:hypothetical protein